MYKKENKIWLSIYKVSTIYKRVHNVFNYLQNCSQFLLLLL